VANEEHVELLKQGSTIWNAWQSENPKILPNLIGADLSGADLSNANLISADLSYTNLKGANLIGAHISIANLYNANLIGAQLIGANLIGTQCSKAMLNTADLSNADLTATTLIGADLSHTNLSNAKLIGANLCYAILGSTNFHATILNSTIFARLDLRFVLELGTAIHEGPSIVDINTIRFPKGEARLPFFRGVGFSETFIDSLPSLLTRATQYESCFLSHAHEDEALARRLYKDLQDKGVRCWFAPHDLRPGQWYRRGIEEAIYLHAKVLLLLSKDAVESGWVAYEVETALNREIQERCELLFPLRLDEAVMQTSQPWARRLQEDRHMSDFTNWHDESVYQQRLTELVRHLKVKPS
jgi:hypothetical protein